MNFHLEDGDSIGGGSLISAIYRTDMVPVPVSLELVVKADDRLLEMLSVGRILTTNDDTRLEVVKSQIINTQGLQLGKRISSLHVIAVLAGCAPLLGVASKATSLENTNFNEVYRALGAKIRISDDIKLANFICLKGHLPTARIATSLQKEAAVVTFYDNNVSIARVNELFNGDAIMYDKSALQLINNPNAVIHANTNYLSIDDDGSRIVGNAQPERSIGYYPRADARELLNLRRILVTKATITRQLDRNLESGNLIAVDNEKYIVLTGVHRYDSGAMGGAAVTATRAWLAQVSDTRGLF